MSLYLLDTNICVHLLKNEYDIKSRIIQAGIRSCLLSEITIAELLFGVENSAPDRRQKNLENVQDLQALFAGRILPISDSLHEYARQKAALRRSGRVVDEFDLLIGSTAIVHGLTLVSRNIRHFTNMDGLLIENWIDS